MAQKEEPIQVVNARIIIRDIDASARIMLKKTNSIAPSAAFTLQQKMAITDMISGFYGWLAINLGELKNEFGIGVKQELESET